MIQMMNFVISITKLRRLNKKTLWRVHLRKKGTYWLTTFFCEKPWIPPEKSCKCIQLQLHVKRSRIWRGLLGSWWWNTIFPMQAFFGEKIMDFTKDDVSFLMSFTSLESIFKIFDRPLWACQGSKLRFQNLTRNRKMTFNRNLKTIEDQEVLWEKPRPCQAFQFIQLPRCSMDEWPKLMVD